MLTALALVVVAQAGPGELATGDFADDALVLPELDALGPRVAPIVGGDRSGARSNLVAWLPAVLVSIWIAGVVATLFGWVLRWRRGAAATRSTWPRTATTSTRTSCSPAWTSPTAR